jgi:BirA family biotin operon repressor/biotin-[acetyl-CoA-carboxylase] ligase
MNAETEQIHFVILGIGINLNMTAEQFPNQLNYPATSALIETGVAVDRLCFLQSFLRNLDRNYLEFKDQGFAPVRSRWEGLCRIMNERVVVQQQPYDIEGVVVGIDSDGALRLQRDDGQIERILAGDVKPLS